jgi:hypothetical protein
LVRAYSRAAKKRNRRKNVTDGLGLAETPKRDRKGCFVERSRQQPEDAQKTVRDARARQMKVKAEDWVLAPEFGFDAGRAIYDEAIDKKEAEALWQLFLEYEKAESVYYGRVIGRPRFAKVAKIEFIHERFETRADDVPDLRGEDERHRDAVNGWMRQQGYIGCLHGHERQAINRAAWQQDELYRDGATTVHGKGFVKALRTLRVCVERMRG